MERSRAKIPFYTARGGCTLHGRPVLYLGRKALLLHFNHGRKRFCESGSPPDAAGIETGTGLPLVGAARGSRSFSSYDSACIEPYIGRPTDAALVSSQGLQRPFAKHRTSSQRLSKQKCATARAERAGWRILCSEISLAGTSVQGTLRGGSGGRLYCRLTSFSQSLQTNLRITLDGTKGTLSPLKLFGTSGTAGGFRTTKIFPVSVF